MAKLLLNSGTAQAQELFLKTGLIRVGRNSENDIQIEHSSVSSFHCEITCSGDSISVKDLGSTNGTFIERRPIQVAGLTHGQRLQLGSVELILDAPVAPLVPVPAAGVQVQAVVSKSPRVAVRVAQAAPPVEETPAPTPEAEEVPAFAAPPPAARPGGQCKYHPRTLARWTCTKCRQFYCDLCVASRPGSGSTRRYCRSCGGECDAVSVQIAIPEMQAKSFFALLPGVFGYPFKKNGVWLLVIGTIVFAILGFGARFSLWVLIFGTGYFLSYMQRIMTSSGYGEEEMPGWPDASDFWADIILPMLLLAGTFFVCIAPGLGCLLFGDDLVKQAAIPLFVLGAFYFPMAVLAVGMTDNIFSLNPLVIIPSIAKLFLPYLVATLFMGVLYGVYKLSEIVVGFIDIAIVSSLIVSLLSLYFTTVQMRILGLLYFTNKDRLGWFSRAK